MHRSCRSLIVAFVEDLPRQRGTAFLFADNAPLLRGHTNTYDEVDNPQSMQKRAAARAGLQITDNRSHTKNGERRRDDVQE